MPSSATWIEVPDSLELRSALTPLCHASQSEGFNMVVRLVEQWADQTNCFNQPGEQLWICSAAEAIIGVGGLNRDPYTQQGYGRVRHVYLLPEQRQKGLGRALLEQLILAATPEFSALVLRTTNPAAAAFYERCGFAATTTVAYATHMRAL